jgi:hypothetical protein
MFPFGKTGIAPVLLSFGGTGVPPIGKGKTGETPVPPAILIPPAILN